MADLQDQEEQIRRRQRGIAFFDHGDSSPLEKASTPRGVRYRTASAETAVQVVRYMILALRGLLILLATAIILGIGLRGIGKSCSHLPSRTPGCRSALIKSTTPYLSTFKNGTTPLTGTFTELTNIVHMGPSLSVLGTAMHLASANFSSTHDELKAFPELYQTNSTNLDNLTDIMGAAIGAAELFSRSDFSYRDQSLLWGRNAVESIGKMVDTYIHALNETSTLTWSAVEQTLHRIPFGARRTPSYDIAHTYFYFGGHQWLEIEQLVYMANDSSIALSGLITELDKLSQHVERVSAENKKLCTGYDRTSNSTSTSTNSTLASLCHLDPSLQLPKLRSIRSASNWSRSVVEKALAHYFRALSSIKIPTNALQLDVKGYESLIPAKGTVSTKKLKRLLMTEESQLMEFAKAAHKGEALMSRLGRTLTNGNSVKKLHEAVDAAVVKGEGGGHRWWGEEHEEL
ncbi:hypothetical protein CLAFUW4_11080 [Fulvia fulva]|nr:hypothetical protein CLAFUR4_11085 [Fulvia fulva]KAK4621161.1 hypothetical protein CLAFUR0_11091 [Fulvia fulva]WPV17641.1 hypothetical protein CLAFUW4_11080 [Fulvia fulva]WPV32159.1 hypothetical protein CLAFUW7_11077 [Fulvia fulva]